MKMNTLREIGTFVGIPQGSLDVARFGGEQIITLRKVSMLVSSEKKTASLRALIQALKDLTPIALEAEIVGSRSGEEPFSPVVRLNASGGITWFTSIATSLGGKVIGTHDILSTSGGDFTFNTLGPGTYQLVASRSGISNSGFVSLSTTLGTISVSAAPPHPTPPTPPTQLPAPSISVQSNGDGSFKVSGSGFVPHNATVNILVGDGTLNQNPLNFTVSATNGAFTDFSTGRICQRPGTLFFEASDGRIDHGSQVFSNTVTTSCPF
jgi:hypothetical protein